MDKTSGSNSGHEDRDDIIFLGNASIATKGVGANKESIGDGEPAGVSGISEE